MFGIGSSLHTTCPPSELVPVPCSRKWEQKKTNGAQHHQRAGVSGPCYVQQFPLPRHYYNRGVFLKTPKRPTYTTDSCCSKKQFVTISYVFVHPTLTRRYDVHSSLLRQVGATAVKGVDAALLQLLCCDRSFSPCFLVFEVEH